MKRAPWILAVLLSVLMTCPAPILADDAGDDGTDVEKPEKKQKKAKGEKGHRKPGLRGEWAIMVNELKLDEAQQAKLQEIVKQQQEERKAFEAKNKDANKQLRDDMKAAKEAGDKEKLKQLSEKRRELNAERQAFRDQQNQAVMAILTPEQQATWQDFQVYRQVSRSLHKVKLTDEQKASLKDACKGAGESWANAADEKARRTVVAEIRAKAVETILTDEQKQQVQSKQRQPQEKKEHKGKEGKKMHKGDEPADDGDADDDTGEEA